MKIKFQDLKCKSWIKDEDKTQNESGPNINVDFGVSSHMIKRTLIRV